MKRLLYLFVFFVPVIAVVSLVLYHRSPPRSSPAGGDDAQQEKTWMSEHRVQLGTAEFSALVATNLQLHSAELTAEQRTKLEAELSLWSKAYTSNEFESYMRFRAPSHIEVAGSSLGDEVKWLAKYRGLSTNGLSPEELLRKVYTFDTTFTLTEVAAKSLQVLVRRVVDLKDAFLSSCFDFHGGVYVTLGEKSPCRYALDEQTILKDSKSLLCVRVAGAYFTSVGMDHPIPVFIFFYWAPSEHVWQPMKMIYGAGLTGAKTEKAWSIYF
jgi:hypothetical protein